MVPNTHAVKGLSRRLFTERRCFSHMPTRNVQHLLGTVNLPFPQPRSRYGACVDTVPIHTVTKSSLWSDNKASASHPRATRTHFQRHKMDTKKDRPALGLHRHHMKAKDGDGDCWALQLELPCTVRAVFRAARSPQPRRQTCCNRCVGVACAAVRSRSAMAWARASVCRLAVWPDSRYDLQGSHKRQPANRSLAQLVCYKLRESSDGRLVPGADHLEKHEAKGLCEHNPWCQCARYKGAKPCWRPVEPFPGKRFSGSRSPPSICAFIPVSHFTCHPLKKSSTIFSVPQISLTYHTFSKFSPLPSFCSTFLHLKGPLHCFFHQFFCSCSQVALTRL